MTNTERSPEIQQMQVQTTTIEGLYLITMKQISESRGTIREYYRESAFTAAEIKGFGPWKQINVTQTRQGAIRGLHGENMQKLIAIVEGEAFGVYVDMRDESPSRGVVYSTTLSKGTQVLVPKGVCNGFQSTSGGMSQYLYCFDAEWEAGMSGHSINPLDPELGITWPIPVTESDYELVSRKDASAPSLREALSKRD
ncbi:MAG: dTDP-4-dehydrorhamnose 3,5-epimerase [Candidatus Woesebacteria bacterium]